MTSLTKKELLAQSLARHHVLQRATQLQVVSDLCGLQAQFATGPREALRIRARDYTEDGWDRGLVIAVPSMWCRRASLACTSRRAAIRARLPRHGMAGVSR